jgi:SAM-dependent methyltransferase
VNVVDYNRRAWDQEVASGNPWTVPVPAEVIAEARAGRWRVWLTENTPVPASWFPPLAGSDVLCLASGGGQQGPVLAAAGARVTVFDNSPAQLGRDRLVAEREGLAIRLVQGDMVDLSAFAGGSFDLVFHPVSNLFAPAVRPVWREAHRVLRPAGVLLAGFLNPDLFIFDLDAEEAGRIEVRHALPYADETHLTPAQLAERRQRLQPLEFSHTLADQIGGQLDAGFVLTALYEDRHRDSLIARHMPTYFATRAVKPPA